jgi:hypothetical protein
LDITDIRVVINNALFSYLNPTIMTCRAFPLSLERLSSSLLSFVSFYYQFISIICLFVLLAVKIYFFNLFWYIILAMTQQNRVRKLINSDVKTEIINSNVNAQCIKVPCSVGPCHKGTGRYHVADGGTPSKMGGKCKYIE